MTPLLPGIFSSGGFQPGTPTIGTATAGNGQCSITFTNPTYLGKIAGTTYRAFTQPVTIRSTTGTIGTVSGSGPYTATISGMSSTTNLFVNQVISATAGTGNFGSGVVTISVIDSSTSVTINSTALITAGTVTNILGGIFATNTVSPVVVPALSNGTAYTFRVHLNSTVATSLASQPSNSSTPFVPFGFTPFGFSPFGFSPGPPVFSFSPGNPGGFNPPPGYSFTAPWSNSIDVQTKIRTPNGMKYAGDIQVGDVLLGLNIPSNINEEEWISWSSDSNNFTANIAETTVTSIQINSGSEYIYIDGDLFTPSHYVLTKKDNIVQYIKADLIDVTYQKYSYENNDFIDIEIVEDISVDHNNISIHCEPHDNFFTEQMLVLESLPH
jgi:hypothetical protein